MHLFFSASRAQENASVMGVSSACCLTKLSRADEPAARGVQVALVKRSTALRRKNLGKVPPRLDTLFFC